MQFFFIYTNILGATEDKLWPIHSVYRALVKWRYFFPYSKFKCISSNILKFYLHFIVQGEHVGYNFQINDVFLVTLYAALKAA